jgi:hypothetical protein
MHVAGKWPLTVACVPAPAAVIAAPTWFFDATPVGRLLNRFSRDVYSVDDSLPFQLNIFLAQTAGLVGTLCVIGYATRGLFLAVLPLLAPVYYRLQVWRGVSAVGICVSCMLCVHARMCVYVSAPACVYAFMCACVRVRPSACSRVRLCACERVCSHGPRCVRASMRARERAGVGAFQKRTHTPHSDTQRGCGQPAVVARTASA